MKQNFDNFNGINKILFLEGDDGAPAGGGTGESSGMEGVPAYSGTLVEKIDPVNGKKVKIPVELEPFFGHTISYTRKETEGKYKPIVEKLEGETAEFSEVKAELIKLREANMTAEEKARADAARKIAEYESKTKNAVNEANGWKSKFQDMMIANDIFSSFGDIKLCNPEQTAILFRNEGKAEVVDVIGSDGKPTGEFQTRLRLNLVNEKTGEIEVLEGTPQELFKKWINEERNLHHQINNLPPGAGSNSGRKTMRKEDLMKLSPIERMKRAREQ